MPRRRRPAGFELVRSMTRAVLASAALGVLFFAPDAQAGDQTLAETIFQQGKALMASGDYARASPKHDESFRQDPATGTMLALAICQQQQGQLADKATRYRVRLGPYDNVTELNRVKGELARRGFDVAVIRY